jgi:putative component of toxin-antitoxin plasmid stabilization module
MPPILDVAIGTLFVFLLFSLVVSACNEFILSIFDLRAKFLHQGLREVLGEAKNSTLGEKLRSWTTWKRWLSLGLFRHTQLDGLTQKLCEHGLLNAFSRSDKGAGTSPSYIPSGAFVITLIDIVRAEANLPSGSASLTKKNLRAWIDKLKDSSNRPKLYQSLDSLYTAVDGDVAAFKTAVEGWFNSSMDRVSGWYKNFSQKWTIFIAIVLAAILNVDTIHIVKVLSNSPNLAKALATQAETYTKSNHAPPTSEELRAAYDKDKAALTAAKDALAKAVAAGGDAAIASARADVQFAEDALDRETKFQKALGTLSDTSLPLGWNIELLREIGLDDETPVSCWHKLWEPGHFRAWVKAHYGQFVLLLTGWFITALAASLGAPFWFDLLGRFINVRAAGRAPGDKDPTQAGTSDIKPVNLDSILGSQARSPKEAVQPG